MVRCGGEEVDEGRERGERTNDVVRRSGSLVESDEDRVSLSHRDDDSVDKLRNDVGAVGSIDIELVFVDGDC